MVRRGFGIFPYFDEIQRMIDETMARPFLSRSMERGFVMPQAETNSDIIETDNEVILTVELPGVEKKDIEIEATENSISVDTEVKEEKEERGENFYKAGSRYFGFRSNFRTPCEINPDSVTATYKNGVLEVKAKKKSPKVKGKKIVVK